MELIDKEALLKELPKEYLGSTVHGLINNAPTIHTKLTKYYDSSESVWKIGEVVDDDYKTKQTERSGE